MAGETTSQALEKVDQSPKAMIAKYREDFAAVLPSHITRPETWIRVAQGALKKGKRIADGRTELEVAADNNRGVFLATLLDAARMGLEPGTEQYYLTARKNRNNGNRTEILGIVGYQGYIELMYRAGAVSSVVADVVHRNDLFVWKPGQLDTVSPPRWAGPMTMPLHEVDWDADDRGALRLTYAYAVMKDGATSKVVVLNRADISRIRAKSPSAKAERSPWTTDEGSMWLKSAVRQLRKWVPTSAEYVDHQRPPVPVLVEQTGLIDAPELPPSGAAYSDDDYVDAELVEEDHEWPPGEEPM